MGCSSLHFHRLPHPFLQLFHRYIHRDFSNLIDALVIREIQPILGRDIRGQEATADEMAPPPEMRDTRLRGSQTDQIVGHKVCADLVLGRRAVLDVPRRGDIDGQHGLVVRDDARQDRVEGRTHRRVEAEAEEGVDDQVRAPQRRAEVLDAAQERDVQVVQLFLEAREDRGVGGLRVVDLRRVAVVVEVAGADEAVAACGGRGKRCTSATCFSNARGVSFHFGASSFVPLMLVRRTVIPRPARDQDVLPLRGRVDSVYCPFKEASSQHWCLSFVLFRSNVSSDMRTGLPYQPVKRSSLLAPSIGRLRILRPRS